MKIKKDRLLFLVVLLVVACGIVTPFAISAQDEPLSYKASPENYKLLAENEQFRVILYTSKPGQRDEWHSHSAFVVYWLTDCTFRMHLPSGKSTASIVRNRGNVSLNAAVASHSAENTGQTDCEELIVERK